MTKNSTPTLLEPCKASAQLRQQSNSITPSSEGPSRMTLDRIRQFARSYSYTPALGAIGGISLN